MFHSLTPQQASPDVLEFGTDQPFPKQNQGPADNKFIHQDCQEHFTRISTSTKKWMEDGGTRIQVGPSGFWLSLLPQALVLPQPAQLQEAPPTLAAGVCVLVRIWYRAATRQRLSVLRLGWHLRLVSL